MAGGSGTGPGDTSTGTPWLFGERSLRRYLSNLYAAMVASTGNARLLLDRDPADVRREDAEGGVAAKEQLEDACDWLDEARILCGDPRVFDAAILGCARIAAGYLVGVRSAGASTAHFDSWVFAKSTPPDDNDDDPAGAGHGVRTIISAVVPCLETCMSVRVAPGMATGVSRGLYRLGPATPMPLTNRLHLVGGAGAAPLPGGMLRLADWHFLKASPSDLHALSTSVEMDAYCEIASTQDDSRQRLAALFVLPGAVAALDDSSVVIRGFRGEEVAAARRGGSPPDPDGLPRGTADIRRRPASMHGRFLVAAWYQPRMPGDDQAPRMPELLHFEACGHNEAILDDLIGYVRMRGRAGAGGLRARYGEAYPSIVSDAACLAVCGGGNAVEYRRTRSVAEAGSPTREFLAAVDAMKAEWRRCRAGGGDGDALPAAPRSIVSEEGADMAALSPRPGRGASARRTLLADLQDEFDRTGHWRGETDDGGGETRAGRAGIPRLAAGLERLGLLRRDGRILSVTDRGQRALAASFQQDTRQYASGKDCLYLPESATRIPASTLLRCLRDGGDYAKVEGPGGKNSLLWVRKGAEEVATADIERYGALLECSRRLILECTRTVNHEINARFVRGELERRGKRVAFLHVLAMLEQLERAGRLEAAGGGSWVYPLRGRILDTMRENRTRAWDMDGILAAAGIGRNDIEGAGAALEGLAAGGLVVGLEDGRWECSMDKMDEAGQRRRRAAHLARAAALSALRQKRAGMDSGRLVELVAGHLSVQFKSRPVRGLRQIARDAVSVLVEDGRAVDVGGMVRLAA